MSSKAVNGLSSSGNGDEPISSFGSEAQGGKPGMEGASPAPPKSGQSALRDSWLALEDALKIFQEDLTVLQRLGVDVAVIPDVDLDDKGTVGAAVVLPNIGFVDGDFVLKDGAK